jgi:phosphate transport system protein
VRRTRTAFVEELARLERQALGALDLVATSLKDALDAIGSRDAVLARRVVAGDDEIDRRYLEVNTGIVALLATEAPVATDLRLATALLHVIGHVERMGDQCVNLAKMMLLARNAPIDPALLMGIGRMGTLAMGEVKRAQHAFALRDPALAVEVARNQESVRCLDRSVFARAARVALPRTDVGSALSAVLMARALCRIGDNAVAIAEQGAFVVTGRLRALGAVALG